MGLATTQSVRDGSLRGVTGPLVRVPAAHALNAGAYQAQNASLSNSGTALNPDGTASAVNFSVPQGLPGMGYFRTRLHGRTIGVCWAATQTTPPFDVIIDGVVYPVNDAASRIDNISVSFTDYQANSIVATGLADTWHTVTVCLAASATAALSMIFYGFIVEQGHSYPAAPPSPRNAYLGSKVTVPTAAGSLTFSGFVAALSFHNNNATTAHTVTLYGPDGTSIYKQFSLAANSDQTITFPAPRTMSGWKWAVDAGTDVIAWIEAT